MSTDLKILIFEPPAGHTFELIYRTRGLCFRVGFFSQLACCGGIWAVGFRPETMAPIASVWRPIDMQDAHKVSVVRV